MIMFINLLIIVRKCELMHAYSFVLVKDFQIRQEKLKRTQRVMSCRKYNIF